ncbi:MAG: aminomethyl-transferring glycine dehydrogenase subunit GcvPA [SAR324 cluster bacterium]|nr:aminomethyl-transferring glycine dehydrogenase subunit GcvPA [SAR324 cluster bacterium]
MRFIPNNDPVRQSMLAEIGRERMEDLFASIPRQALLGRPLDIPPGMAEEDQLALFAALAAKNSGSDCLSFLGGGSYSHTIPLVADSLLQRGEFLTAYTPYQPEVSQGTLQAIFEFQTFMAILTGMDVANASVYDGASAAAEAVLMADRLQRGRSRVILAASLHPYYRQVIRTYTKNLGLVLEDAPLHPETGRMDEQALAKTLDGDVACVVVQQPNFFGVIEDLEALGAKAKGAGALLVTVVAEALSMALLKPPGQCGADIVAGEAQSFGVPQFYGGPYLGFMATRDEHKRQLPGRIAGETVDLEGRRGYVLTLATREQHIRREKATSNICTNENLVMLYALIYLTLMGREGLKTVAESNVSLMAYFLERVAELPGYEVRYSGPRFNEVALRCPRTAREIAASCQERRVLPGIDLGRFDAAHADCLLVAVTETKDKAGIDALVDALQEAAGEAAP